MAVSFVGMVLTPWTSIERTLFFRGWGLEPLEETVHVEDVFTSAPDCASDARA